MSSTTEECTEGRSTSDREPPTPGQGFWRSVIVLRSGCWIWTGGRTAANGYGVGSHNGKRTTASRVAFMLATGREPAPGNVVRHTCDEPLCVNPAHLLEGTPKDNSRDACERGQVRRKLSPEQVLEIRSSDEPGATLAQRFGVTRQAIHYARTGHSHQWVTAEHTGGAR